MKILHTGHGAPSPAGDACQHCISSTSTGHNVTNCIHGSSNTNVGNVSNSYNNTINLGGNEESRRIQTWLSPLEPYRRHQDVRNRRLDGVGEWVLRRDEFKSWRASQDGSHDPTLRCYGDQGVGKTYIRYNSIPQKPYTVLMRKSSSLVIDIFLEEARGQNIAVLYFYCDYQAQKDQSAANIIGGLLKQVAVGTPGVPDEIKSAFESRKGGGQSLRVLDMLKLLVKTVSFIRRVYICIDAVDELRPQDRSEFLRALRQIIQNASNVRLFLTGRPYVRVELDNHLMKGTYTMHIVPNQGDIGRYISRKMDDDDARDPHLMTEDLKSDITSIMLEKASEM